MNENGRKKNNIESMTAEAIAFHLGVDSQLASLLDKHKPYSMPEDALRVADIYGNASIRELTRILDLIDESLGGVPPTPIEIEALTYEKSEMTYGVKKFKGGIQRIFIASEFNFEIISAEIDASGELNIATLRILSRLPHQFAALSNKTLSALAEFSNNALFSNAGLLAPYYALEGFPKATLMNISTLADLAAAIGPTTINGCGPEGFIGINPSFKECCYAHDICYGRGGTEEDRLECDSRLYDCIKEKTGPLDPRARLFYWLVLAFGRFAFEYKGGGKPVDMDVISTTVNSTGKNCRWDARLMSVEYSSSGENIGELTLDVVRNLEKQMRENPNSVRRNRFPKGRIKYGKKTDMNLPQGFPLFWADTTCGAVVKLPIYFGDSSIGSGQNVSVRFICNGFTYEKEITIKIDDAIVKFKIQINTTCAS
ncbi:hypothetical protein [Aliikangiella sp. G2MR2-5]|uniref:hypothetical protein n=1 Tax=Aliikangiella sp. G2MR2-5 TaxID=2788943 RepID=UPI0018A9322C|nr:hypothetical protein [Aliikangiella sp. G2MR2-5]